jgi:hypothetical protein
VAYNRNLHLDQVEALLRAAVPTIPAGAAGVSIEFVDGTKLPPEALPHAILLLREDAAQIDFGQSRLQVIVPVQLWVAGATVEEMRDLIDAVADAVSLTTPTQVLRWSLTSVQVSVDLELEGRGRRLAEFTIEGSAFA